MIAKTVVLHYKKLKERKESIIDQLEKFKFLDYSFYENYDQDELSDEIINSLYKSKKIDKDTWQKKVLLWGVDALRYHKPLLNSAEISLTIKFGKVFQQLVNYKFDYCIIFEDDVILCEDFNQRFFDCLSKTPDNWDAVYFGSCFNLRPQDANPNQLVYLKHHPSSKGGASTLFKYRTIVDLSTSWFPFNLVSDWELSAQHKIHNHKVYWWEPALTKQGSETGLFKSTLR